jgi:hypothetical protein
MCRRSVLSPDAERMISFTGRVNGNDISFVREITPLPGGGRGGTDLFGGARLCSSWPLVLRQTVSTSEAVGGCVDDLIAAQL